MIALEEKLSWTQISPNEFYRDFVFVFLGISSQRISI